MTLMSRPAARVVRISPTASDPDCPAAWHLTGWAFARYGCRCPEAKQERKGQWHTHHGRSYGDTPRGEHARHYDVDPVLVERAAKGDYRVRPGTTERRILVARLTAEGLSAQEIAKQIGLAPRSVTRIRRLLRAAS